jgi:hypothetical protein
LLLLLLQLQLRGLRRGILARKARAHDAELSLALQRLGQRARGDGHVWVDLMQCGRK